VICENAPPRHEAETEAELFADGMDDILDATAGCIPRTFGSRAVMWFRFANFPALACESVLVRDEPLHGGYYYRLEVMVDLGDESERPSYHVVPSKIVAATIKKSHSEWLEAPGVSGKPCKNSQIRNFSDKSNAYLER